MPALVWDQIGDRLFETGLDRGVLYLASGLGIPWNGLTSVTENGNGTSVQETFFDGVKNLDIPLMGNFSGSISAITYPDEFLVHEGIVSVANGIFLTEQTLRPFGLSYRTLIGNDVENENFAYKLHVLYDLTAVPQNVKRESLTDSANLIEFNWNVTSRPQITPGHRPTAHVIIDSRMIDAPTLQQIENILYGSPTTTARLPPIAELIAQSGDFVIVITDNGDGTWTATGPDSMITMLDATTFQITDVNAVYLNADTYDVSST